MKGFNPTSTTTATTTVTVIPIQLVPIKVKGHKDRHTHISDLTDLEVMNVDVDKRAKLLLKEIMLKDDIAYLPMESPWFICYRGKPIVSSLSDELYKNIGFDRMMKYYIDHGQIKQEAVDLIDWNNQLSAIKGESLYRQRWVSKFVSNTFGVGVRMKQ